jgi:abequosyltransferase
MNNSNEKYKVSICIPTYNYGKYLRYNLEMLVNEEFFNLCEIVIGDGGSTDETEALSRDYQKKYKNIRYYNFKKKLGIDKDLRKTSDLCNGKYIWFLSADDIPTKGCLKRIFNDIVNNPTCILYDRIICDYFLNIIKYSRWSKIEIPKILKISNEEEYAEYLNSLCSIGGLFSYMSVIVINREAWNSFKFINLPKVRNYQHVVDILNILQKPEHNLYIPAYFIVNFRGDNDSFLSEGAFNRLMIDFRGYKSIARMYDSEKISFKFKQMMRYEHKWYFLSKFLVKINGRDLRLAIGYLNYFGYLRFQILFALVFSRLSFILNLIRSTRRSFLRINRSNKWI